jgi:hypothetical protein
MNGPAAPQGAPVGHARPHVPTRISVVSERHTAPLVDTISHLLVLARNVTLFWDT